MIILMKKGSTQKDIDAVVALLKERGLGANLSTGSQATVIGVLGDKTKLEGANLELMEGVEKCVPIMHSYKLASREMTPEGRIALERVYTSEQLGTYEKCPAWFFNTWKTSGLLAGWDARVALATFERGMIV